MNVLIFVYHNKERNKTKVLNHQKAEEKNKQLIANGWKHTATLDACVWIEHLCNNCEEVDLVSEIKDLKK
jgi:hypothetical protein